MTKPARLVAPVVVVSLVVGAMPAQAGSGQGSTRVRAVAAVPAGLSPASTGLVGLGAAPHSGVESAGLTVGSAAVVGDTGQGSRDAEDASALALRSGQRVAIESLTTGTDLVWATPSGAVAREVYASPVRVRRDRAWVPVDSWLVAASGGWWAPRATLADVDVSGRPAGAAVRVRVGGATARLGSGRRATPKVGQVAWKSSEGRIIRGSIAAWSSALHYGCNYRKGARCG